MSNFDWKKHLIECLKSTEYCCIATVDPKGVWSNPVYFAWDGEFNLYFISQPHTRHMQNIKKNSRVSVAIYSTNQPEEYAEGIQIEGEAFILKDDTAKFLAFKVYYGRDNSLEDNAALLDNSDWQFVKIIPEQMYYFNSKIFGEERQTVPKLYE
jgi:nitroimidazol reductase NimA-like FMN-containing flavoprotein (pyridoxamine 5'-phosphate oxidase superfamily)